MSKEFPRTFIPTECISFPRCGHHALTEVMRFYFAENFHYGEIYRDGARIGEGSPTNWQKNHDFNLDTPVLPDRNYIVQIRNPLEAIESWEKLDTRVAGQVVDTCEHRIDFYANFVKKWLYSPVPWRLVVWYEDLMARPVATVTSVIQFVTRTQNVDVARLQEALFEFPLERRTQTCPTKYNKA
jgi:hypothetical protein